MSRSSKSGFSIIELVIIVAVVGLGGFLGYTYYTNQQTKVADTAARTADVPAAPVVNTTADLTTAEKALDGITVGSTSDSSQLDAELANF